MFAILTIFPLSRLVDSRDPPDGLLVSLWTRRVAWPVLALAAVFSGLELAPYAFPGDRTLTGEGRLYALHMFDARPPSSVCGDLPHADGTTTLLGLQLLMVNLL